MAKQSTPSLPGPEPVVQRVFDFSGGINARLINSLKKDNELIDVENGFFDVVGAIKKRGGSTLFTFTGTASPVIALHRFYLSTTRKYFLWATADGNIGWVTDDGLTVHVLATLSPSNFANFLTALDTAIFTNGVDFPQAITETAPGVLAINPLGGMPPVSLYSVFHVGRLFLAGDPLNPSKITFSDSGTINSFPATNTLDVSKNDGSFIRGMLTQGNPAVLIIYKDTSIYSLAGDNVTNFALAQLQATTGIVAPKSLKDLQGIHFFLGRQGSRLGIYTNINGIITRVSQNIDPLMQTTNLSKVFNAAGFVDFPYYYLSVPNLSSTFNNLVFVFDASLNAFVRFTNWSPNVITSWPGGQDLGFMFYGDGQATGNIIQMFVGFQDQGSNYNFNVITKYYDFTVQELVKLLKIFYLTKESTWPGTGTIALDIDFANTYANAITLSSNGWAVLPQNDQGQFFSFQFHDFSNSFVELAGFTVLGEKWQVRPR